MKTEINFYMLTQDLESKARVERKFWGYENIVSYKEAMNSLKEFASKEMFEYLKKTLNYDTEDEIDVTEFVAGCRNLYWGF